jgi:hypothetical protein
MATKIQVRRGTAAEWASANPVLSAGEPGFETDTGLFKVGDGSTAYNDLPYFAPRRADEYDSAKIEAGASGISSATNIAGLTVTADVDGSEAIRVHAYLGVNTTSAAGTTARLQILEDGVGGTAIGAFAESPAAYTAAARVGGLYAVSERIVPTSGSHDYIPVYSAFGGGTATYTAAAGLPGLAWITPADT